MTAAVEQARDAIQEQINQNPINIIIYRDILIDNGFGDLVPDPFNLSGIPANIRIRIIREKKAIEQLGDSSVGLSTQYALYILVNHKTTINQYESFEAYGKRWSIGPVEKIIQYGSITGYRAPITEAEEAPEAST